MKRRLSIAISSIANPKVIIYDEPTTGLDPIQTDMVMNLIKQLRKDRIIILTTHSMEEAEILSDKLALLKKGKL